MEPKVSIIIPTYNRCSLLGRTLDSVMSQTFSSWECIVVDDGSTDYTSEIMHFYTTIDGRIKYLVRPNHLSKGANSCRNYGFKMSRGSLIQWFDSDDLMLPLFLEIKVKAIQEQNV